VEGGKKEGKYQYSGLQKGKKARRGCEIECLVFRRKRRKKPPPPISSLTAIVLLLEKKESPLLPKERGKRRLEFACVPEWESKR